MDLHEREALPGPNFNALKEKQRAIRDAFPEALALRVHRALSWLGRAEDEVDDTDVRFILLWVGFNSAYAGDLSAEIDSERGAFKAYFDALVSLDGAHRIYNAVWKRFPHEIRLLLNNKYVFAPFWNHQNGLGEYSDWAERLARSQRLIATAMAQRDTPRILSVAFDRLYVLRNQLIHGGATWNSAVNRNQVRRRNELATPSVHRHYDGQPWSRLGPTILSCRGLRRLAAIRKRVPRRASARVRATISAVDREIFLAAASRMGPRFG